eukprot:gene17162-23473_t
MHLRSGSDNHAGTARSSTGSNDRLVEMRMHVPVDRFVSDAIATSTPGVHPRMHPPSSQPGHVPEVEQLTCRSGTMNFFRAARRASDATAAG